MGKRIFDGIVSFCVHRHACEHVFTFLGGVYFMGHLSNSVGVDNGKREFVLPSSFFYNKSAPWDWDSLVQA